MTLVGPPPACCLCLTSTLPPHIPVHACCRPLEAVVRRVPATTAGDRGAADVSSATLLLSVDNGPHNVRSCASNGCPKSKASSLVSDCHIAWTLRVERVWRRDGRREGGMDAAFFYLGTHLGESKRTIETGDLSLACPTGHLQSACALHHDWSSVRTPSHATEMGGWHAAGEEPKGSKPESWEGGGDGPRPVAGTVSFESAVQARPSAGGKEGQWKAWKARPGMGKVAGHGKRNSGRGEVYGCPRQERQDGSLRCLASWGISHLHSLLSLSHSFTHFCIIITTSSSAQCSSTSTYVTCS